jgi:FixJ family two-component response regulator
MWKAIRDLFPRGGDSAPSRLTIVALVLGDRDRQVLADVCALHPWDLHFTSTFEEAWAVLNHLKAPLVLCDRDCPGAEWREVVQRMASSAHRACVILLSGVVDDYLWNEVNRKGGYDVLSKPLREDDVVRSVKLARSYWSSSQRMARK